MIPRFAADQQTHASGRHKSASVYLRGPIHALGQGVVARLTFTATLHQQLGGLTSPHVHAASLVNGAIVVGQSDGRGPLTIGQGHHLDKSRANVGYGPHPARTNLGVGQAEA